MQQREREDYQVRLDKMERDQERVKQSLLTQVDSLQRQLDHNVERHTYQVQRLSEESASELKALLKSKDDLITTQQEQIMELKVDQARLTTELQQEREAHGRTRKEQISEKARFEESVRDYGRRHEREKNGMREEYEKLIQTMREEFNHSKTNLRNLLDEKQAEIDMVKREKAEMYGQLTA